ncbi:MAG TPA: 1-acyl-sn-glycerol-3-phosphate acyltransferase, partial [bacterium]|nr:1-acyl-sn-glycerol-3-phosphate acyltransferase [bacterium]
DPPVLGVASSRKLYFLARRTLFKNRLFSLIIRRLGAIPIEREGLPVTLRKALNILKEGKGIVIFPEGTRSKDGKLKEGKPGVGFLAVKGRCPVVPVLISGTEKALPVGAKFIKPAKIKVKIGKPLFFNSGDYFACAEKVIESIRKLR